MTDLLSASLAGVSQMIVGHPFDTVKVLLQNKKSIRNLKFRDYYRGYQYPLASSIIVNSILFPVYERTQHYTNSAFISGYLGGAIISPFMYISDYNKIKRQTKHKLKIIYGIVMENLVYIIVNLSLISCFLVFMII